MGGDHLIVERDGPGTVPTLNRPEARNALGPQMLSLPEDGWVDAQADDVRCVVLTGARGHFCAGRSPVFASADAGEGTRAHAEKRQPEYRGR